MKIHSISKVAAGIALAALAGLANASTGTVFCPSPAVLAGSVDLDRGVQVTNAEVGGQCQYYSGNLDSVSGYPFGFTLIDKDIVGQADFGTSEGALSGTIGGTNFGTWSVDADVWSTWERVALGFHFGNGTGDPDSFIVELNREQISSGNWAFLLETGAYSDQTLSNLYLFGIQRCQPGDPGCESPPISEPAALALLGIGGLAAALAARRRRKQ